MYAYPEEEMNGGKIIQWFSEVFKDLYGEYPPEEHYGKYAGFIRRMRDEGYDWDEIMTLVWGVCNEKRGQIQSLVYCWYFRDEMNRYKKIKEKYNSKESVNEEKFVKIDMSNDDGKGEDFFDELL